MSKKGPLAVVTMLYNESDLLPIWIRHYTRQVGPKNCFVLDHGSTDGATHGLEVNVIRLPRSPFNELGRAESCSRFCASLLYYYDYILFTDVDEIVLVDPEVSSSLAEYASRMDVPVLNCFGMDLVHQEESEAPLQFDRGILQQRHWVIPTSVLCKPTFASIPMNWRIGFHACEEESRFGDLYLLHLAYVDFDMIKRRQEKRNGVENLGPGSDHHRIDPELFMQHIRNGYTLDRRITVDLSRSGAEVQDAISVMLDGRLACDPARGLLKYRSDALWKLPDRFRDLI